MDSITSFHESLEQVTKKHIKDKSTFINNLDISKSMFYRWLSGEQLPREEMFETLIVQLSDQYSVESIEIEILKMNYAIASLDEFKQQKIKGAVYFLNTVSKATSMSNVHTTSSFYSSSNLVETITEKPFDDTRCIVGIADVKDILLYMFKASITDENCHEINILARPDEVIMDTIQLGLRPYREDFIARHFFNVYADSFSNKNVNKLLLSILNTGITYPNYIPNTQDAIHRPEGIFNTMPYVMHTDKRLLLISANYDFAFYYYPKNNFLPLSIYKNYFSDLLQDESASSLFLRSTISDSLRILNKLRKVSRTMRVIEKDFTCHAFPFNIIESLNIYDEASLEEVLGETSKVNIRHIKCLKHFYRNFENNNKTARITLTKSGMYDFMTTGRIPKQDAVPPFTLVQRVRIIQHLIKLIEIHDNFKPRLLRDDRLTLYPFIHNLSLVIYDENIIISPFCNNTHESFNNTLNIKNKFLVEALSLYYEHVVLPKMSSKEETLSFLKEVIASHVQEQK